MLARFVFSSQVGVLRVTASTRTRPWPSITVPTYLSAGAARGSALILQQSFVQGQYSSRTGIRELQTSCPSRSEADSTKDESVGGHEPLINVSTLNNVTTIRMNRPEKLNAWTGPMMSAVFESAFAAAAEDSNTKAVILTGTGRYYCAGVDLSATIRPMHPKALFTAIFEKNQQLFEAFLGFPKPILVACNGPAVGASVTSASLCDAVIAADTATFSTPFAALGVPAEGCSSYHFPLVMGDVTAQRMLGSEGWRPDADEARDIGLIEFVSPSDTLMQDAQAIAEGWVAEGKPRQIKGHSINAVVDTYRDVNRRESLALANAFLSSEFLEGQSGFLRSKGKNQLALVFRILAVSRPLWSRLL